MTVNRKDSLNNEGQSKVKFTLTLFISKERVNDFKLLIKYLSILHVLGVKLFASSQ